MCWTLYADWKETFVLFNMLGCKQKYTEVFWDSISKIQFLYSQLFKLLNKCSKGIICEAVFEGENASTISALSKVMTDKCKNTHVIPTCQPAFALFSSVVRAGTSHKHTWRDFTAGHFQVNYQISLLVRKQCFLFERSLMFFLSVCFFNSYSWKTF